MLYKLTSKVESSVLRTKIYNGTTDMTILRITILKPGEPLMRRSTKLSLVQAITSCRVFSAKSSSEPILNYCPFRPLVSVYMENVLRGSCLNRSDFGSSYVQSHKVISDGRNNVSQLIFTWCCIYAWVNWASIASGNGLSPALCQAITWTNAESL